MVQTGNTQLAQSHAAVVSSTLNTLKSYVEWVPVSSLFTFQLINACGFLLTAQEFQISSCEIFKLIASRRKPQEDAFEFSESIKLIFQFLINSASHLLSNSILGSENTSDQMILQNQEFLKKICEALTAFSTQNLNIAIDNDESKAKSYFEIMIRLLNVKVEEIHSNALSQWLLLIREMSATFSASENQTILEPKTKKANVVFVPYDILQQILTFSFQNMPIKGFEEESDGFQIMQFETDADYGKYRNHLIELIRNISVIQPILSLNSIFNCLNSSISAVSFKSPSKQNICLLERVQIFLENTFSALPESFFTSGSYSNDITSLTERLIQQLINLKFEHFDLIEIHGHFLNSVSPYLKHQPSSIPFILAKFFSLLNSIPMETHSTDVAFNSSAYHSRLQICSSFLRMIRNAHIAFIPYLQTIADQITALRESHQIRQSELNHLGESLLLIASFAGPNERSLVTNWLLEPIKSIWMETDWQSRYLSDPLTFARHLQNEVILYSQTLPQTQSRGMGDGNAWFIFHMVALFEKILRSDKEESKNSAPSTDNMQSEGSKSVSIPHPMTEHMSWILPPLLQLLRIVHSLWNHTVKSTLPKDVLSALSMNRFEISSFMGESSSRVVSKAESPNLLTEKGSEMLEGSNSRRGNSFHNWIKGVRENIYAIIGQSAIKIGHPFFDNSDGRASAACLALVENLHDMELHHLRQMIRLVLIPLCKHCPYEAWDSWLPTIFHPLFSHCQNIFLTQWPLLIQTGSVSLSVLIDDEADKNQKPSFKKEVLEEKLLRDLTREFCSFLSLFSSIHSNKQTSNQQQQTSMSEENDALKCQTTQSSETLLSFLLPKSEMFLIALRICMECLNWPDSDASHKSLIFLSGVVNHVSDAEKNGRGFLPDHLKTIYFRTISGDLFLASIRSLTLESNAPFQADILTLIRDIYFSFSHTSLPHEVLLSFPVITAPILMEFDESLKRSPSVREQRQLFKSLFQKVAGNQLKAFSVQKSSTAISSVNLPISKTSKTSSPGVWENEKSGLASIGM